MLTRICWIRVHLGCQTQNPKEEYKKEKENWFSGKIILTSLVKNNYSKLTLVLN